MDSSFNLAVHTLVCLSHSGRSLSSEVLAENICTNPTRVRRVMMGLKKAGLVETREGLDGGYRLTTDPAALTLRQVAEAVNTRFVDCAWHSGDIDRDCAICSGMAGVMDARYGRFTSSFTSIPSRPSERFRQRSGSGKRQCCNPWLFYYSCLHYSQLQSNL